MIRVTVTEADGRNYEIKTDEPYNPDTLDDIVRRVVMLQLTVQHDEAGTT